MRRLYLVFSLTILFTGIIYAESTKPPKIVGKVENKETQEEVPYLTVFIKNSSLGTTTNLDGTFEITNLAPGDHIVRIQGIGYKPVEVNVSLEPGEVERLDVDIEKDIFEIESAVVSANRNKTDRSETPVIINSITPKVFEQTESVDISESLNFSPGLRTENSCQNCGAKQIRMNGLEGQYTQVLINSKPLFSSLSSVYGIEQIPSTMIERVEVIRGGGSALFGGNAIAGTINLITKDPLDNSYNVKTHNMLMAGESTDLSVDFNTSVVNEDHTNGIYLFGMNRNRDFYDANNDGFSEIPVMENTSFGFRSFFRPDKRSRFVMDFTRIKEHRRGGNNFGMPPHEADIAEKVDHNITGLSLSFDRFLEEEKGKFSAYACGQILDRESYYGAGKDPLGYGETVNSQGNIGFHFSYKLDNLLFAPSEILVGMDDKFSTLDDESLGADSVNSFYIARQKMNTIGGFVQSQWDLNPFKFIIGVRLDHYSIEDRLSGNSKVNDFSICPRMNVLFDVTGDMQWRFSFAKGYRPPKIYSEDLHIESSRARQIIHRNSSDLREENSYSFSSSIDYTTELLGMQAYFLFEGFYTILDDPFSNEIIQESDEVLVFYRINAENGAHVRGLNFESNLRIRTGLDLKLGMTVEENTYKKPQQWGEMSGHTTDQMLRTPDSYGYLIGSWEMNKNWSMTVTGNYTGSMLIPHFGVNPENALTQEERNNQLQAIESGFVIEGEELVRSSAFYNLGFNLNYAFNLSKHIKLDFKAGVKNIFNSYQSDFDQGVYRDAGYIYGTSMPRTFYLTIKIGNG